MANVINCVLDNEIKELGERIRLARVTAKLTQKEFSEKIGISRNYLSLLEKGKSNPSFDILVRIDREIPGASGFSGSVEVMSHRIDTEVFGLTPENIHSDKIYKEVFKPINDARIQNIKYVQDLVLRLHNEEFKPVVDFIFDLMKKRRPSE